MAATELETSPAIPLECYDTALCIIPPKHVWQCVDRLRSLYDKAFEKWPPHINLIYPFTAVADLPRASGMIQTQLESCFKEGGDNTFDIRLDTPGVFPHRLYNPIFIRDNDSERSSRLDRLRTEISSSLRHPPNDRQMHMTIGQSQEIDSAAHRFLLEKARLLPPIEWRVGELCILVRERKQVDGKSTNRMELWGTIDLTSFSLSRQETSSGFYEDEYDPSLTPGTDSPDLKERGLLPQFPYMFSTTEERRVLHQDHTTQQRLLESPEYFKIASYNVQADFEYPLSQNRYPIIVENLLHDSALADVLILEEVTDNFLSYIAKNEKVRKQYIFISSGPPSQPDLELLASHLNMVIFSRWSFSWEWLPFQTRHKGTIIARFGDIGKWDGNTFVPAVLSTVHLTCGLTDESVASKKLELHATLKHLSEKCPLNPWILVGDFNIPTSTYAIEAAVKRRTLLPQTVECLHSLEDLLAEAGLVDSWAFSRVLDGDFSYYRQMERLNDPFGGEQGATFDPTLNDLAAETVGSGFNNRPQRYDRILVRRQGLFSIDGFNNFGHKQGRLGGGPSPSDGDDAENQNSSLSFGSDHWGVRCSLRIMPDGFHKLSDDTAEVGMPVSIRTAPSSLDDVSHLRTCLADQGVFPTETDSARRGLARDLLRDILIDSASTRYRGKPAYVLVPVGSYGLGVWTSSSDIDYLCIGPISSKTFFTLAAQRLRKAASRGIRIMRRVNANSGAMLELEVLGIKMDLQYCPSAFIASNWPHTMHEPPTSPIWSLPVQALAKLKPLRDLYYLRRTIPDYAAFRTAYRLIRFWAKKSGIYAAKFGYLSGIQISILLACVCKSISQDGRYMSVPTILTTFFSHYASFDWKTKMVFDPFFHKSLRYSRASREPLVILGYHSPTLNTALSASLPSVRTISEEFKRADGLQSQGQITWSQFLGADAGAREFLQRYKSYVKIDVQFWGVSLAKGSGFAGWLESRCVMLLVGRFGFTPRFLLEHITKLRTEDLGRKLPTIHARIWPERYMDRDASEEDKDYQGCYLIGLDRLDGSDGQITTKEHITVTMGSLQTSLQKFEGQIRRDEKHFDPKSSWMSASVVKQSELGDFRLDTREWGEYTVGEDESEDEEEEEEEEEKMEDLSDEEIENSYNASRRRKHQTPNDLPARRPVYTGKFRSSADVINRLRWDTSYDSSDYIVGYEDRFLGVKERALDAWKAEQTDEEFIPQHRILYFKRASDGVVVWDRKERRDVIFGSGVSSLGAKGERRDQGQE